MQKCKCGSSAINPTLHGRDGSGDDVCDVCYWRLKAERLELQLSGQKQTWNNDPALVAEVERLRSALEKVKENIDWFSTIRGGQGALKPAHTALDDALEATK